MPGVIQGTFGYHWLLVNFRHLYVFFLNPFVPMNMPLVSTIHRQDLNVSFLKGQKYKLQNSVAKISNEVHVSLQSPNVLEVVHSFQNIKHN